MPKNQSTAAKKARAVQREAGGKHTTLLAGRVAADYPGIQLRLTWEERDGGHWTTYQGRHYALIIHGAWYGHGRGDSKGQDIWYLHEMTPDGNICYEDERGDELEGWWIAGAGRIRKLRRHLHLMRIAELHIDGWSWHGVYPDGTKAMSRSTYDRRQPLPDLLYSTTLGPWPIPDGVCGSFTDLLDPDASLPCPHPRGHDFPCNPDPNFDAAAWKVRQEADRVAEEARWAALTPEERAAEEADAERARYEWEADQMRAAAASEYSDDKYYGDED